jgi:hypothetical protein
VKSVTDAKGGTQIHEIRVQNEPVEARFVRIFCKTRNTGYGASLWELEVYGENLCDPIITAIEEANFKFQISYPFGTIISKFKFIKNGQIYISRNGAIYTIDGRMCVLSQE